MLSSYDNLEPITIGYILNLEGGEISKETIGMTSETWMLIKNFISSDSYN